MVHKQLYTLIFFRNVKWNLALLGDQICKYYRKTISNFVAELLQK